MSAKVPHRETENIKSNRRREKWKRTREKLQRAHIYKSKLSSGASGAARSLEEEPGEGGRGGRSSTMPQCSPSARPRNKAQWLHCQLAFSCTFIGLPDTMPLPFFNNQHNNLFRGRSNGLLLHRRPERGHSAPNGRCLR